MLNDACDLKSWLPGLCYATLGEEPGAFCRPSNIGLSLHGKRFGTSVKSEAFCNNFDRLTPRTSAFQAKHTRKLCSRCRKFWWNGSWAIWAHTLKQRRKKFFWCLRCQGWPAAKFWPFMQELLSSGGHFLDVLFWMIWRRTAERCGQFFESAQLSTCSRWTCRCGLPRFIVPISTKPFCRCAGGSFKRCFYPGDKSFSEKREVSGLFSCLFHPFTEHKSCFI